MTAPSTIADAPLPDLVRRWMAGWTSQRRLTSTELLGHPLVRVAAPSRETELIAVDPTGDELPALLDAIRGEPTAMLTVFTALDAERPALDPTTLGRGVRIERDTETLMTVALADPDGAPPPAGLRVGLAEKPHVTRIRLLDGETVAAWGSVGLVGADAVFDRIETVVAYQRRGIGSWMMRALTRRARALGAVDGLLTASADGAALYAALGWTARGRMASLLGTAD